MSRSSELPLLTAAQVAAQHRQGTLVLDTRPAEHFAGLHIRGSVQISLMGHFAAWAAILIDANQKLLLIAEDEQSAREARNRLVRVGLERIVGYSLPDERAWSAYGIELGSISTEQCATLAPALEADSSLQLIDVRSRAEWLKGHLPRAISIPLLDLDSKARRIPPAKLNFVYCHEGYRATTAASILLREGAGNIGILIDGIEGWSSAGLPLEK